MTSLVRERPLSAHAPCRARHGGRPVRRLVQSAASGPRAGRRIAIQRLGLDQLWWMVTPGNPLKNHDNLAPLADRIALSENDRSGSAHQGDRFRKGAGAELYRPHACDTSRLRNRDIRFVWIMGADNLKSFHRWQNWQKIARTFPIAVIDRPGSTLCLSLLANGQDLRLCPRRRGRCPALALHHAPAWTFIHGPRSPMSSTALGPPRQREIERFYFSLS